MGARLTKKRKEALAKLEKDKLYSVEEAVRLIKEISFEKFDASVDLAVRLGVDPRKADQMVRGTIVLPHGTGKEKKILALCLPEQEQEAKDAGADYVGLDEYIKKIQDGWLDFDVVVATPQVMSKVSKVARILGPRGLMPNPKSGTVSQNLGETIKEIKRGKISFKVDKYGIVHVPVGRVSFPPEHLEDNINELVNYLIKIKPASSKGTYIRSIFLSTTMSPSIPIDPKSIKRSN